jgi:mercuric reductase
MTKYELAIIGKGAAAFAAAIKASELSEGKLSIAMIGKGMIGGTCVNVGCVPSKYLIEASNIFFYSKERKFPGIENLAPKLNFKKLMDGLNNLVSNLREEKYVKVLKSYPNVDLIEGEVEFLSSSEILVKNDSKKTIHARNFLIAVGSSPSIPPIEGLEDAGYLTSDTVWNLDKMPESITVLGAGAIGLELGQAFSHLGSSVSLIEAAPRIIPTAEPEISEELGNTLEGEGINILTKARIARVYSKNGKKVVEVLTSRGKTVIESDEILVATGRKPNTQSLKLDKASVKTDVRGFIVTDEKMRTSNPSIYAAGDCISKTIMLETLAAREGTVAASNILGLNEKIEYLSAPWAVFTTPQIAAVGYTEEQFMKINGSCSCRVIMLRDVPKSRIIRQVDGLTKLVINPSNGRIVGVHVLSPYATEFIMEGVYAVKLGLTYEDVVRTTHVFPTLAESIKIAGQAFMRDVKTMSCCVE